MTDKTKDIQDFQHSYNDQMDRLLEVDAWKQWAKKDGVPEPYLGNVCSWSQRQVLGLAEQVHDEIVGANLNPDQPPEVQAMGKEIDARVTETMSTEGLSRGEVCLRMRRADVKKFVYNFRPEHLVGHSWKELRRSNGPMRSW